LARIFGMPGLRTARPGRGEASEMQPETRGWGSGEGSESFGCEPANAKTEVFSSLKWPTTPRSGKHSIPASGEVVSFKTPYWPGWQMPALKERIHVWDLGDDKVVQRRGKRRSNCNKRHRNSGWTLRSKSMERFQFKQRRSQKLSRRRKVIAAAAATVRSREVVSGRTHHRLHSDECQAGSQSTTTGSISSNECQCEIGREKKRENRWRQCRQRAQALANQIATLAAQVGPTPRAVSTTGASNRTDSNGRIIPEAALSPGDGKDGPSREGRSYDWKAARMCTPTSVASEITTEGTTLTTAVPTSKPDTMLHSEHSTMGAVAQEWWREQAAGANIAGSPETENVNIECNRCSRVFATQSGLDRHMKLLHQRKARLWDCEVCLSAFSTPAGRHRHWNAVHADVLVDGDPKGFPQHSKGDSELRMLKLEWMRRSDGDVKFGPLC
jgi:hypothetical protein